MKENILSAHFTCVESLKTVDSNLLEEEVEIVSDEELSVLFVLPKLQ